MHIVCSTISVMDDMQINEQNKSIGIGLLYVHVHPEYDRFSTLVHGEMGTLTH